MTAKKTAAPAKKTPAKKTPPAAAEKPAENQTGHVDGSNAKSGHVDGSN